MNKFFLDLGKQPLANNYLNKYKKKQVKYNLRLYFNTKTKLVSISKRIPSKKMFNNKYPYRSSISKTMQKSFYELSLEIKKKFKPKMFLEIGSNDGAFISNFKKEKVICIEPCKNLAKITKKKGYKTYSYYWNSKNVKKIKKKYGRIDLIYSANTITHISDLNDVFKSISYLLSEKGILIIEDPSLLDCLRQVSYDQFYNEHIYVFSALAVKNILKKYNLELFDIKNIKTHGGSLRYYIKKEKNNSLKINSSVKNQLEKEVNFGLNKYNTYKNFAIKSKISKKKLNILLRNINKKNNIIVGYGATAKVTTVLNYCDINTNLIKFFIDTTPDKQNKYIPGKNIKIYKYNKKLLNNVNYAFLGAWNFKNEIFKKEMQFRKKGGKFITHIPSPKII